MKLRYSTIVLLLAVFVNVACGSQKTIIKNDTLPENLSSDHAKKEYFKAITTGQSNENVLTAKIKSEIGMGDKSLSTSGTLRLKKGEVIQISLLDPFAKLMEVLRIEFTNEYMLMIDRFHKRYIQIPYEEVDFLKRCDIDFNALENLFWNQIFVPAKSKAEYSDFVYEGPDGGEPKPGGTVNLKFVDEHLTYKFSTRPVDKKLTETLVFDNKNVDSKFSFSYFDFNLFQGKQFPAKMTMAFKMGDKEAYITFSMNSLKNKSGWVTKTELPKSYTKEDPERIFQALMGQ